MEATSTGSVQRLRAGARESVSTDFHVLRQEFIPLNHHFAESPPRRIAIPPNPIPFSPALEDLTIPNAKGVFEMAKMLCGR